MITIDVFLYSKQDFKFNFFENEILNKKIYFLFDISLIYIYIYIKLYYIDWSLTESILKIIKLFVFLFKFIYLSYLYFDLNFLIWNTEIELIRLTYTIYIKIF